MIIDSHTHIFPDAIAERAITTLESTSGEKAVIGGTLCDLINMMNRSGIDKSVVLPVITKPEQFESVNAFAEKLNQNARIIAFAGMHPLCENINKLLDLIVSKGFRGVKLHPDYQETDITDERYIKILEGCRKRGLKVIIHAGVDPQYPNHVHCPPDKSADVIKAITRDEPFIVLAHLGGAKQTDLVERFLVGLKVYFDLSYVLEETDQTRLRDIIKSHGVNRILFATDSPWRDATQYLKIIKSLPLSDTERDAILWRNCAELLNL